MSETLTLTQGIDSGFAWPVVDEDGEPAVLTGYTAACQVRKAEHPTAPLLTTLTATVTGSDVAIQWTAEESLLWDWASGVADVVLSNAAGRPVQIVWAGQVRVDRVVTHA